MCEQCLCINSDYALKSTPTSTPAAVCAGSHQDVDQHRCMPDAIELALDLRASKSFIKCNHAGRQLASMVAVWPMFTEATSPAGRSMSVSCLKFWRHSSRWLTVHVSVICSTDCPASAASLTATWRVLPQNEVCFWQAGIQHSVKGIPSSRSDTTSLHFNNVAGNSAASYLVSGAWDRRPVHSDSVRCLPTVSALRPQAGSHSLDNHRQSAPAYYHTSADTSIPVLYGFGCRQPLPSRC